MRKRLSARVTRIKLIANITDQHRRVLEITDGHNSMGMIACNTENIMYPALDDASKEANIKVVYACPAYMGRDNLWAKVRGQVVGIISGESVANVRKGLDYLVAYIEKESCLYTFDEEKTSFCYTHLMPRCGPYYRRAHRIPEGMAAVHLAAAPLDHTYALDKALKAGDTKVASLFELPSRSNVGGAVLYGTQEACRSSMNSYLDAVEYACTSPMDMGKG